MSQTDIDTLKSESRRIIRHPTAKVAVTWGGSSVDPETVSVTPGTENRASLKDQVLRGIGMKHRWAYCYVEGGNSVARLNENICAMPDNISQGKLVGWWSDGNCVSAGDGRFSPAPTLTLRFPTQTVHTFRLQGYMVQNDAYAEWPLDFDAEVFHGGDEPYTGGEPSRVSVVGNTRVDYRGEFAEPILAATSLRFTIRRWSHSAATVKITAAYNSFSMNHTNDDIFSMSVLEEADGSVGTLPVGNISSNEADISLQNIDDRFFIGNTASQLSNAARNNRRLEPFIGFFDSDGIPTYIPKGVYWTSEWSIPQQGTDASTSALDRLGLLQAIEYGGLGGVNASDAVAEATVWKNASLYDITAAILMDVRDSLMNDLAFSIDDSLREIMIPLAFFERQSYFDVLKTIAQAAAAYVYMDTPTDAEKDAETERGNVDCADILRIKSLARFTPTADADYGAIAEELAASDVISMTLTRRSEEIVNAINVKWQAYQLNEEGIPEEAGEAQIVIGEVYKSIIEYGRVEFRYEDNNLIQTQDDARRVSEAILKAFSGAPVTAELSVYGDVTRRVGDVLLLHEYQKHGIDTRGYYAVTKVSTEYDGGIRQTLTCRKIADVRT